MSGVGKYKLSDALGPSKPELVGRGPEKLPRGKRRAGQGASGAAAKLAAEQLREARESTQARNAEASSRDHMVEIGRGNQQAGRQRAK